MKALFISACIVFSFAMYGQKHSVIISYKPSFTYLGKQRQTFDNSYITSRKGNNTYNTSANILYSIKYKEKFNFTAGVEYSQQGQNINFNILSNIPEIQSAIFWTQLNYIRFPLTLGYEILKRKNEELAIQTGLSLGIATKRKDNYNDIIREFIILPPAEERYNKTDLAMPIGIVYQRNLTRTLFAYLGAEYMAGLTSSFSKNAHSKFGVLSEFNHSRQNRLSVNIGIGVNLMK